jgi:LPXTG-motif cell wall-anchored protein
MSGLSRIATVVLVCAGAAAATCGPVTAGAAGSDPFSWAASPTPTVLSTAGRIFAAASGDTSGTRVVLYGGQAPGSSGAYGDTWVNGADGTWKPTCGSTAPGTTGACGPGVRDGLGMANTAGGVILYGGFAGSLGGSPPNGDTWRWNGVTWARVCTSATCGPGPRALMAMAGNGTVGVMFGGLGGSGIANDTWVFDGTTWTQACGQAGVPCGPIGLAGASMAWDGQRFVLFGGADLSGIGTPVDDTWTFNGHTWTKVCGTSMGHACGPAARDLGAFTYAGNARAPRGAVLAEGGDIFGNGATQHLVRDAWLFDGTRWSKLDPPWNGATETFPNSGAPPAGPDPLLGMLAPKPALCEVVYLGASVAHSASPPTLVEKTFVAGRAPWTPAKKNCAATMTAQPGTATTTVPTRLPALVVAPVATAPTLPKTGSTAPAASGAIGIALVAIGVLLGRLRETRGRRRSA